MYEIALIIGGSLLSLAGVVYSALWWNNRRGTMDNEFSGNNMHLISAILVSITAGYTAFVIGERGGLPQSTADAIGFGFILLALVAGALTAALHGFNRPRFLVPKRFRHLPGELEHRRQRREAQQRRGRR